MPTLLQINVVVNTGSTGRIAEELGQIAMANGWQSYIAYGRNERPSQSKLIKIGTDLDLKWHGLQTRLFDRHGLASYQATLKLIEKIKELNPDIIHLHNLHGYYLNIYVLYKYLSKTSIPIVWTLHDCWSFTGHCTYFDFIGCEKWKTECYNCPQKNEYPKSLFIDRSKKNFQLKKLLFNSVKRMTIIPVSQWLGNIVHQSFLKTYPIQVINNGIDTEIFKPTLDARIRKKYKLAGKFIILGVTSTWDNRKGLADFKELSKRIDSNSIIILVGLSLIQIKNLPTNMIGILRTENTQELAEFYSTANVFLNPTWEDNFPTTNLESLACGTPVVTYKTGGSIESISPETGFIVEKGDIEGLINVINTIRENGKEQYTQHCREHALKMYDKNDRYQDYLNLYNSILN